MLALRFVHEGQRMPPWVRIPDEEVGGGAEISSVKDPTQGHAGRLRFKDDPLPRRRDIRVEGDHRSPGWCEDAGMANCEDLCGSAGLRPIEEPLHPIGLTLPVKANRPGDDACGWFRGRARR